MSRKIENVVYRPSWRNFILTIFAGRSFSTPTSFIMHYPDQKTTTRKMQMRSNSANSAMVSRQSSPRSRTPALPTLGRTQP